MNYVYIIKSKRDFKRYIGLTNNLVRRLSLHNNGKVQAAKNRIPFELIYYEDFEDRIDAAKREKFLKSGKGREFLNSILK
jgi:putative endonuclease